MVGRGFVKSVCVLYKSNLKQTVLFKNRQITILRIFHSGNACHHIIPRTRMHRDRHVHRNVHTSIQRGCRMGEDRLQCHREGPGAVHAFALGHFHFKYPLPSETPYLKALVYKYLPT